MSTSVTVNNDRGSRTDQFLGSHACWFGEDMGDNPSVLGYVLCNVWFDLTCGDERKPMTYEGPSLAIRNFLCAV